ncbi:UvrD-helicase domain-containing protein [Anaerobranca gottschalkii]|uniref:DNA 3'-5' helicase n=1 Tax=Anaerobranca gottschalkii DSM 13577 TaxID=1120990 RepID=A0A1H9YHG5_9FIRM|nr:UvrD-helicase domain-containing protein [Anaerobranca gottschalkii]SES68368.1 ATP-dependent exoDNAse (exonuclease V) beta subunit (contains helicase and exonuclease domains) [Anaerobranca gottschalkii DSM 13577]
MEFNPEQKQAIESKKRQILISAGAGSGKTRVLTERFFYLCNKKLEEKLSGKEEPIGAEVKEIVAITFTEKAAREMKTRIGKRITKELEEVAKWPEGKEKEIALSFWQKQKEELDFSIITTFHSFCYKLLQNFAFNAQLPPTFTLLDQRGSKLLKNRVFNDLLEKESNFKKWKPLFSYYNKDAIKKWVIAFYEQIGENPQYDVEGFCEKITSPNFLDFQWQMLIEFKRNLLTDFYQRAEDCIKDFPPINSVTGTLKKYFWNLKNHIEKVDPNKLHPDECYQLLLEVMPSRKNQNWLNSAPDFYEFYEGVFKDLKGSWKEYGKYELKEENKKEIIEIIELFTDLLSSFAKEYNLRKEEGGILDFSDLQKRAIALLGEEEEVRKWCRKNYKHIMIDEFQDTNLLQLKMLEYIDPQYRFIVGDGKQSIYRFRGADVTIMNSLQESWQGNEHTDIIQMGRNYRNCDGIIGFVNELFKTLLVKDKSSNYSKYYIEYQPLISNRVEEFEKLPNKKVELLILNQENGEDTEYDLLAQKILELVNTGPELVKEDKIWRKPNWRDIAILIQGRTQLSLLQRKLRERNIPYYVHGGIGFFNKSEVQEYLNILRFINRPWEELYILALLRGPLFRMRMEDFFYLKNHIPKDQSLATYILTGVFSKDEKLNKDIKEKLTAFYQMFTKYVPFYLQADVKEALLEIFEYSGLKRVLLLQPNSLQSIKNVEKLIDIMVEQKTYSLEQLLENVDILASLSDKEGEAEGEIPEGNMVTIMTVHGSKGLEFPVVFLPGLNQKGQSDSTRIKYDEEHLLVLKYRDKDEEENYTPCFKVVSKKETLADIEESKRLFYVALTRARDYLVMTSHIKKDITEDIKDIVQEGTKNSWYNMLLEGLKKNENLKDYIRIKNFTGVPKTDGETLEKESFYMKLDIQDWEIPLTFSVSEVMMFINDPVKYYDYYIVKIDPTFFDEGIEKYNSENEFLAGMKFGTLVHRVCELYDQGYSEEEAVELVLEGIDEPWVDKGELEREILKLLEKYKEIGNIEIGEHVASEWSFTTELAGAYIVGEIDKIYLKNGKYHLLDLKTNVINNLEEQIERYLPQIYLYKMAFEREFGGIVENVSLLFLREGIKGLKTIATDVNYGQKIEEAIKKMIALKKSGAGRDEWRV